MAGGPQWLAAQTVAAPVEPAPAMPAVPAVPVVPAVPAVPVPEAVAEWL